MGSITGMTLPYERTNAVAMTEKFLMRLVDPKVTPGLPKHIRQDARALLRHYPSEWDLNLTIDMCENRLVSFISECPFGKVEKK